MGPDKQKQVFRVALRGDALLTSPRWNKGTAFTTEERHAFGLTGRLPYRVNTVEEQVERAYDQLQGRSDIGKNSFLQSMKAQNWVLYYSLIGKHLHELVPIIYTPTEAEAISQYSHLFRRSEGLFLTYPHRDAMEDDFLEQVKGRDIDLIVCSDAEAILGIGDQGVGGIGISAAKSAIYTLIGGIDPAKCLAVTLDVGTDNEELLHDKLYVGWPHERVRGKEYDDFMESFVQLVRKHLPHCLLHFEDFGVTNANRLLARYRDTHAVFNDDMYALLLTFVGPTRTSCPGMTQMTHMDPCGSLWIFVEDPGSSHVRLIYGPERAKILLRAIHSYLSPSSSSASRSSKASANELRQDLLSIDFIVVTEDFVYSQGTGAVALATLMAAVGVAKTKLGDQKVIIYGAGSAGLGIARQLRDAMVATDGISKEEATSRFYLLDRYGLVRKDLGAERVREDQAEFARAEEEWNPDADVTIGLLDVVKRVHPTVLIGTSTHAGAFTKEVIEEMAKHVERPIIFPLSNPSRLVEVHLHDANEWTGGKALLATGSPFPPAKMPSGKDYNIAECNNALVYPGLGFGAMLAKSKRVTDTMIIAGAQRLAALSPALADPDDALLPDFGDAPDVNFEVGVAVAEQAVEEGTAGVGWAKEEVRTRAEEKRWQPVYGEYIYDPEGET